MKNLYNAVKAELAKIDFNAIWPGFAPVDFALIDGDVVYLDGREIPRSDNLWGCTVTEFEGKPLAIWTLQGNDKEDAQLLASNMVHEMFHAFQGAQGMWKEGGDEFTIMAFPDNLAAYRIKAAEANLLARAYIASDPAAFSTFTSLRQSRREMLGNAVLAEFVMEEIEGGAEYAGLCALRQLSPAKFDKLLAEKHLHTLQNSGEMLFAIRRFAYFTGAVLLLTLEKLGIEFYHVFADTRPLFDVIAGKDNISENFEKYYSVKKGRFDNFLAGETEVVIRNERFRSFDPMNMWRISDQIFCQWGIGFESEIVKGPLILNMEPGSQQQVVSIIRRKKIV